MCCGVKFLIFPTVENITPPLSGWEGDLALLNQSNNLARFIQGMRRRFQETC